MAKRRDRRPDKRVKERILIICEGKKTEPQYFKQIKTYLHPHLSALNIDDKNKYTSAVEIIVRAKELMDKAKFEKNKYQSVWAVFDKDNYTKHAEAFRLAKKFDVKIAFSSICFEFWYLLHFVFSTAPHESADELEKILKKYLPDYNKSAGYFDATFGMRLSAIDRAERVRKHCIEGYADTPIYNLNPYTNVDELVKYLYAIAHRDIY